MEKSEISKKEVAKELRMDEEKFERECENNWSAEDLLRICRYLQVDPRMFWERTLRVK